MVQLIQLRQRVKAIETIKKITHAMRLISMTTHARLKHKHADLITYQKTACSLFERIQACAPTWSDPIFYPSPHANKRRLYIIVSSNKGLCGNFNTQLFKFIEKKEITKLTEPTYFITIGRRALDYSEEIGLPNIIAAYPDISFGKLDKLTTDCTAHITNGTFTHVALIGTVFKSFFKQIPQETVLIPFKKILQQAPADYLWEQQPDEILPALAHQCLTGRIYHNLFESLLAEQAARFLSMDNATRNATQLLEDTQQQYNKARQLKITKELTELIGGI